ncbi:UbiA-like polyprenyltransferase [Paenibacillus turpanensis]|uniref:UbiA-like polyprenyltransferase n=1 Tax=Paenibacillus turpanensis TaxID=2689078 RepID=UPI00140A2B4F|nr:UbiA-like polyprenyltransferase [Paenibacillus turpanensis]
MISKIKIFLEMIKFEHTIFALPFAFMGAILGAVTTFGQLPTWPQIGWITLAMVGARSAAMGLNRVVDKAIDAKNPRTAMRAIPAGLLSSKEVLFFIAASFLLLYIAASQLSALCVKLMPIAVFFLVFYSYTKRFTWLCHLVLGLAIGLAPLGGWVAVTGSINATALVLYVSVVFWIAGFDLIYSCQDIDYDRKEGLFSIPSRFGLKAALMTGRVFHAITAAGFGLLFLLADLNWLYLLGTVVSYLLLIYEHRLVNPNDLSKVNLSFFTMNGVLSMVMFVFTFMDVVVLHS